METVNELIVTLVTGSNEASRLAPADVAQMLALAAAMIRRIEDDRAPSPASGSASAARFAALADQAASLSPEEWQRALRQAAERLRQLHPEIDADRAAPTHQPDGGDGGNY